MHLAHHIQALPSSYIREILAAASEPSCISFAGGLPCEEYLPLDLVKASLLDAVDERSLFQYGGTQGYLPLLSLLKSRFDVCDAHDLLVTNGSQQGLDLVSRAFLNIGDTVVMEAPSYLGAIQCFNLQQANIKTVSQTDAGPNLEQLETQFKNDRCKIFYAVPDFHNPTGVCWSLHTRKAVAALCEKYEVLLLEDAPYRELRFSGNQLPQVSSFCPNNALTLSSFSKIATPGFRLGCVHGPIDWISALIRIKQGMDLHTNLPLQFALHHILNHSEFNAHLEKLRVVYGERYETLNEALAPLPGEANQVEGGMFLWFTLAHHNARTIAETALKNGLAVVPSDVFYPNKNEQPSALRLNFSHSSPKKISEGVDRLKKCLD